MINEDVKIIPTPGHTLSDVTVLVTNQKADVIAIAGITILNNNLYDQSWVYVAVPNNSTC